MPSVPFCCRTQPYTPWEQVTAHIKIQCLSLLLIHISIQDGQTHLVPSPPMPAPHIHTVPCIDLLYTHYIQLSLQFQSMVDTHQGRGREGKIHHSHPCVFYGSTHDNRLNSSAFQIFLRLETK